MDSNKNVNSNDGRKITFVVAAILVLMLTTTGGTYAYLALSASSNNIVSGTVASGGLNFQLNNSTGQTSAIPSLVKPVGSYASAPMIPQLAYSGTSNILQAAVNANCVDGNSNVVCRIYTFTIRNTYNAGVEVNGRVYFSGASTNLRWALMDSASTVNITGTTSDENFRTPQTAANCTASTNTTSTDCWFDVRKSLTAGDNTNSAPVGSYQQYWLIFWINETGFAQEDSGTWYATIEFTSSDGKGVTSTITGA